MKGSSLSLLTIAARRHARRPFAALIVLAACSLALVFTVALARAGEAHPQPKPLAVGDFGEGCCGIANGVPAALYLASSAGFSTTSSFPLNLDGLSRQLVVDFGRGGKICGPIRLRDDNGRVLIELSAGHCVPQGR